MRYVKLLVLLFVASTFLSCKKTIRQSTLEKLFKENILDSDYTITYANDEGTDITALYTGYSFLLKKGNDLYSGQLFAKKDGITFTGSWESNDDYGKLKITLPDMPAELRFLTREWRFKSKKIPVLKFAPWGSDAPVELTMERK